VYAEEMSGGNENAKLSFRATNLDKKVSKTNIVVEKYAKMFLFKVIL
jgi:hypothetical protein